MIPTVSSPRDGARADPYPHETPHSSDTCLVVKKSGLGQRGAPHKPLTSVSTQDHAITPIGIARIRLAQTIQLKPFGPFDSTPATTIMPNWCRSAGAASPQASPPPHRGAKIFTTVVCLPANPPSVPETPCNQTLRSRTYRQNS